MLDLVFQNLTPDPPSPRPSPKVSKGRARLRRASKKYTSKFFEKIFILGIRELKLGKKSIEISVNLVGERKIKELNNKYRHKNEVTDVLSFPMSDNASSKLLTTYYSLQPTDLGDLFICLSFAKNEAKRENVSIERKLAQLTAHGFLHLLGYDHEKSKRDAEKMSMLENKILARLF